MVPAGGQVISREASEVRDVLGEQDVAVRLGGCQNVGARPAGQAHIDDRAGLDATDPQRLGERWRVHLVEQQLQNSHAETVSRRCSSIRASTSSG